MVPTEVFWGFCIQCIGSWKKTKCHHCLNSSEEGEIAIKKGDHSGIMGIQGKCHQCLQDCAGMDWDLGSGVCPGRREELGQGQCQAGGSELP